VAAATTGPCAVKHDSNQIFAKMTRFSLQIVPIPVQWTMDLECAVDSVTGRVEISAAMATGAETETVLAAVTAGTTTISMMISTISVALTISIISTISVTMDRILVSFQKDISHSIALFYFWFPGGQMNFNNFGNCGGDNSFNDDDDGAFRIHMRGLPFASDEIDIREFFAPLKPLGVEITQNDRGRHAGEANIFFSTIEEIDEAMKKHKEMMGSRWIELFFKGFVAGSNNGPVGSGFGRNNMRRFWTKKQTYGFLRAQL
jgi:hypothetical protein